MSKEKKYPNWNGIYGFYDAETAEKIKLKGQEVLKEIIYEVGDVVTTPRGEGKIVYKDVNPANYEAIKALDSIGDWLYMVEINYGKYVGPYKYYQLNQTKDER